MFFYHAQYSTVKTATVRKVHRGANINKAKKKKRRERWTADRVYKNNITVCRALAFRFARHDGRIHCRLCIVVIIYYRKFERSHFRLTH